MMHIPMDLLSRMLLCVLLGGVIGMERELRSKSAGFRTMILICLGAGIFTMCSAMMSHTGDFSRIASNVVVGIGFVGAGVIFKGDGGVSGLTTAATIWVTAGIGMLIGCGQTSLACAGTGIIVIVLFGFTYVENWMDQANRVRVYRMVYPYSMYQQQSMKALLKTFRLRIKSERYIKEGELMTGTWSVQGTERNQQLFIRHVLDNLDIRHFEF